MKIVVSCSQGCKFPVNLDKHENRDHVFCPKHHEKIKVRKKHFFSPNPDWKKEKESRKEARDAVRAMKRKPQKITVSPYELSVPLLSPTLLAALELSRKMKNRKVKSEKE